MTQRMFRAAGAVLTLAFLLWQVMWAVLTPAFRGPDEPSHVNSVLRLANGGGWPDPGTPHIDNSILNAARDSGFIFPDAQDFATPSRTSVEGTMPKAVTPSFAHIAVVPHGDRAPMTQGDPSNIVDQMTQHPPLFYALEASVFRAVGADSWHWDRQLLLMRLIGVLLTVPVVPCLLFTLRRIGCSRPVALAAASTVFAVPQLAFATGIVTNDSLAIGAGALSIAACAAAMWGRASWRTVFAAGGALGLGLWSKGTFIPMGLLVVTAFLAHRAHGAFRRRLAMACAAGGIGLLIGGFWWIRNIILFGTVQPAGYQTPYLHPGRDTRYFIRQVVVNLTESSWGRLGWMNWQLPLWLLWGLAAFTFLTAAVVLVRGTGRDGIPFVRGKTLVLVGFYPLVSGMIIAQAWITYRSDGTVPGTQGRYLLPGVVGLLAVSAAAWAPLLERATARAWIFLPGSLSMAIGLYAAWAWARACYPGAGLGNGAGAGIGWARWAEVAGISPASLGALVGVAVVTCMMATTVPLVLYLRGAPAAYSAAPIRLSPGATDQRQGVPAGRRRSRT